MITFDIDVKGRAGEALADIIDAIDGPKSESFNQVGGRSANTAAIDYHQQFNKEGGWKGSRYLSGPGRKSGEFGQNVALGWNFKTANKSGATIANNADFLAFKVSGGTVKPKRVKNLTIPMIPEAVGRRARDYESYSGNTLFRVLGKKALFEKTTGGGIRAVYALVKQVTHKPWPRALPDKETLGDAFSSGWLGALSDSLEEL